jgi:hypothetical protein
MQPVLAMICRSWKLLILALNNNHSPARTSYFFLFFLFLYNSTNMITRKWVFILCRSFFYRTLYTINNNDVFIVCCFIVRIIEAIGAATCLTAAYSFATRIFRNHVPTVMVRICNIYSTVKRLRVRLFFLWWFVSAFHAPCDVYSIHN